jgi:DNA-directed RNA polymerase specialized sigma24 family protein
MGLSDRLNEAHCAGDIDQVIRLVHIMALSVTEDDEEAAEAATDEIVMALVKGEPIENFSAWARVVIKRTAWKVWELRKQRLQSTVELDSDDETRESVEIEMNAMSNEPDWHLCDEYTFDDLTFPTPEAETAYKMRLEGKTAADIAEHFGTNAETMQKRMRRWAPQIGLDYEKLHQERMERIAHYKHCFQNPGMKVIIEK